MQRLKEISPRQIPHYVREFAKRVLPGSMAGVRVWGPRLPGIEQFVKELGVLPAERSPQNKRSKPFASDRTHHAMVGLFE